MKQLAKYHLRLLLAAASLAVLLTSAQAATYSLAGDFSYTENTTDSLWSFRMDDYANNPPTFLPLLDDISRDANTIWGTTFANPPTMWSQGGGYWGIGKNTTGVEQTSGDVAWAPDEVLLHPRGGGSPARLVICWRAPRSMVVNLHYSFRKASAQGDGVGYELRTRVGGVDTEVVGFGSGYIGSAGSGVSREQLGLSFNAGDQMFFRIDTWGDAGGDITGAAIEITEDLTQAKTFSLAGNFTYTENNADSLWSFRMDDYANNPPTFLPLLDDTSRNANTIWGTTFPNPPTMWSQGGGYWGIGKNTTGVEQDGSGVAWAPDEVLLHPKGGGSPARLVICWKAPRSMVANVHYSFRKAMACGNGVGYELRTRVGGADTTLVDFNNIGGGVTRDQLGLSFGAGDQMFFRIDTWGDAGCDITGAAIEITEVVGPPTIGTDPSGGTVAEGCNFTFNVAATNATGYAWYKGNTLIPGAGSASYSIIDARTSDAATYTVVATNTSQSVTSAPAVLAVAARPTYTTVVLTENFSAYRGNQNNLQYQTGLKVAYGGILPAWNRAGEGAIHAVDRTGAGDYAVMIWSSTAQNNSPNVITVANPIPANALGGTYHVDFVAAPATYGEGTQATTGTDGMVIDVLRGDGSVLATYTCQPGAWGTESFTPFSFEYSGDGSGDVRLRVGPLTTSGHFGGAIDNLRVATDYVPPTPPEVTADPVGGTVAEGCNFSFSVLGNGALGYFWLKDGSPIPGATGASYAFIDAKTTDAGSYTVVLTNAVGSVTSAPAVLTVTARPTYATVIFTENFSAYSGIQNNRQYQTMLNVSYGGTLPLWGKAGGGAIHAVDRTESSNYAVMIWQDNVITLNSGIGANELLVPYHVDFVAAPATYSEGSQATTGTDGLAIDVLRGDGSVLATYACYPGAWGTQGFTPFSFEYTGDGSGDVWVRVGPLVFGSGHFGGAIDNLRVATDVVPSVPPVIQTQPVGGTVMEGDDFTLSVLATGMALSYQWHKDNNPIPGATNASYTISNVQTNDAGTYLVVVLNAAGYAPSDPAVLDVTPAPTYATYTEAVLTDNPIHYYPLDDTSGTVATDLGSLATSGGTYLGGFTLGQPAASPRLGSCVRLNGASGTLVDLGLFHPGDTVSAEAWVLVDADARVGWNAVVSRFDGSYELANNSDLGISFAVYNDASALGQVWSASPPARALWHHVVGVFSGGTATVYVDGVKGGVQTIGGVLRNAGPSPDRVMIGATRDGTGGSAFNLKGSVDEVAIYDTALSPAQIRAHYRAAQSGPPSLTIQRTTGGKIIISWPSFSPGFVLQAALNVTGVYENYTGPVVVQGNNLTAEVPLDSPQRFFRLSKQ